jgi:tight adherence protein C
MANKPPPLDLANMELPLGLTPIDAVTIMAAVGVLAIMVAIWAATTVRDPMQGRVKALQAQRDELKTGLTSSRRRITAAKSKESVNQMRNLLNRMQVLQAEQSKQITEKLMKAGWRSKDAVVGFQFARLVCPFIFGAIAAFLIYGMSVAAGKSDATKLAICLASVLAGYFAPNMYVKNAISKRTDILRKGLPDALDLLVICSEAGLTIEAAFNRVSKELGTAYPELGDEMGLAAIELGFLQERRQAYDNLANRVDLKAMRGVVTTLIQTEKYGTPLASALRVLSAEFRNERMMRAEEKAARLPAIMTVPLILFILPTLFIVLVGPAACKISDNF